MSNDDTKVQVPQGGDNRRQRATVGQLEKLSQIVVDLTKQVATLEMRLEMEKPSDPTLPMTREYFMALAIVATIQSGGWQQLKYVESRAGQAYDTWVSACRSRVGEPEVAVAAV